MNRALTGTAVLATAAALAITWSTSGYAQAQAPQAPPQRIQVVVTQLVPSMLPTWEDLVRNELIPVEKKAGRAWRRTLASVSGQGFTRVVITPVDNFAEFDQPGIFQRGAAPGAAANFNAKVRPAIHSQETFIYTLNAQSSIVSNGETPPPIWLVQSVRVLPGRGGDFQTSLREDYLPAYRKAGVTDYWVYGANYGDTDIVLVRPFAKYAELDQPGLLQRGGLSPEAIAKVNARRNPLLAAPIESNLYRFVPELSYGAPRARSTN
jgi:hypothetical protein